MKAGRGDEGLRIGGSALAAASDVDGRGDRTFASRRRGRLGVIVQAAGRVGTPGSWGFGLGNGM